MKKFREEAHGAAASPARRPQTTRADATAAPTMATASPAAGSQKLTAEDAMTYLKDVKRIFENDKERYDEFLEAMRDFKSQRIDTNGVIQRVKELFKGHTHLILGFNAFLPKGYEITLPSEEKKPVEFEQAISFVNKIKNRFSGADHVYKSFLDILNMYRSQSKSIQEVYNEVSLLFQNHKDLLDEFTHFLPEASGVSHHHAQSSRPSVPRDDKSFARPVVKSEHADQPRVRLDRDRSVDRPDIEHEKQRRRPDKEKSRQDEKDIREHDKDDKHLGTENREIDSTQQKKKPCRRADDVTERFSRRELNIGVYSISPSPHMDINDFRNLYIQEFTFCEKVKERLSTPEYQEFLQCLHIYSKEIVTRADLKNLVTDVIGKYADLMNGFEEFLTKCENIDGFLANIVKKKHQSRSIKPEDQNLDRESDRNETGKERDNEKERDKDMERFASKDTGQRALFNREKSDFYKPIAELDLSDCERCTPSYRLLPKNYPITSSSHRSKSGASVLNDFWVSVTSGSEDYSFKHMRKNQYEESLFRCEDDRFEMDMLLESVNAATRRVEDLLEKMQDNTLSPDTPIQIEDHLTALNLRCIERLYGDHGLDVMDVLRKKASLALPVILTRLKQKQEEWSRCRSDFNKVWAEVYAKNYHKSLDHRSFYFKQQDMKNLATKALVAEIKEMNEKRREDDLLLAVAAGNMWPMAPNIELEFSDSDIHNDIYDIIKYSCREVCSSVEQVDKLMRIWTTLLDLMLGTSQFHAAEDSEDAMDMIVGNSCGNNSGSNGSPNAVCVMSGNRTRNPANRFGDEIKDSETDSRHDRSGDCQIVEKQDLCAVPLKSHQSRQAFMAHSQQTIAARSSEGFVNVRPSPSAYEDGNAESTRKLKRSDGFAALNNSKTEKEEGELSPKADSEEDNFEGFDGPSEDRATSLTVDESNVRQYTARRGKSAVPKASAIANDPDDNDDGEESTQRSTEDSENACEDGEDPSGSESADAEESSHEENAEDVEQDDHTKPESESEAEEVADEHDTEGGVSVPLPDRSFVTAKPLARHVPSALHDNESNGSHIFYGNDAFYVFFRLHRVLYERMLSAKKNSASSEQKWKNAKDVGSLHLYERFRSALHNFLDGSSDSTKYEDECRATNGTQSYMLFTLDKLVYKIVKQLQGIASDDTCSKLFHLYVYEKSRKPGRFSDLGYYEDAQVILQDENIYRFETSLGLTKLTINLMERCNEKKEAPSFSMEPNFSTYLYNKYLSIPHGKDTDTVFLERNKRKNESYDGSCAPWDDFDRTVMYNGLECKLSSSTSKITYVLNTEDLFYRKKRRRMGDMSSCYRQGAVKVENFNRWLDAMTT